MLFVLYLLAGCLAGFMAGLFGIGGGLVIVPLLLLTFAGAGMEPALVVHTAIGSSLAIIALTLPSSAWQHWRQQSVLWADAVWLVPGLAAGAALGAWIADALDGGALSAAIGVFALATAVQVALDPRIEGQHRLAGPTLVPAGAAIGTLSTLFGIGGGSMIVPLLHWAGRGIHKAIGTSALCTLPVAITGAAAFALLGPGAEAPAWSTGYVHWPAVLAMALTGMPTAVLGARVARVLSPDALRRTFAAYLLAVGAFLLARGAGLLPG